MTIAEIIALITQIGPLGFKLFLALEARLSLTPDEKLNIANALAAADTADQDTVNHVAAWMLANGFKANVTFTTK